MTTLTFPDFSIESAYSGVVVSIDEVGRGPWAGPVLAAAVVLKPGRRVPKGIHDSKLLTREKREALYDKLIRVAQFGIGAASVAEIEEINIAQATMLAMRRAYEALGITADIALVDGNMPPGLPCPTRCIVKGDSQCISIAAASIIAKVTRDRLMAELALAHPGYGWERNVGYGTKEHQRGILNLGLTPHHRRTWNPVRVLMGEENTQVASEQMELLGDG